MGYIGLSLGPQNPRGFQQTVVRIESMAGIWSFRLNFVKHLCLNYYSWNLVLLNFRGDNARVFQRVSMNLNMTVGQAAHTNYCVDILKARWLRPAFAESYRLLRMTMGAIWWGTRGTFPPTFSYGGDIICHVPPLFSVYVLYLEKFQK